VQTSYITTDLDIESAVDLQPLANSVGDEILVHYCGPIEDRHRLTLGIAGLDVDEDQAIKIYCDFINSLDRDLLTEGARVTFNVGYEAGDELIAFRSTISKRSLDSIASVGGEIMVTIYRNESSDA
jgi:hypothetical protein